MPWKEVNIMDARKCFVAEALAGVGTFSALCRKHGISRQTGYLWLRRFRECGCITERSRAPHSCPHKTPEETVTLLLQLRDEYPYWGPKKLVKELGTRHGIKAPSPSTAGCILKKHGLVADKKPTKRQAGGRLRRHDLLQPNEPNDVWCIDYKGWFRLGDRSLCHPLTITDLWSRFLLDCRCHARQDLGAAMDAMKDVFARYGLPRAIRVDNGTPFGSTGLGGFTALSVWWLRLGISVDFIEPGKPQQNGSHERMHRTLKLEATIPPEHTLVQQQQRLDTWRCRFNEIRPHEALGQVTPSSVYRLSSRRLPHMEADFAYPSYFEVRQVRRDGMFKWAGSKVFLGQAYVKCRIGLIRNYDENWLVYVGDKLIGGILAQEPQHVVPAGRLIE